MREIKFRAYDKTNKEMMNDISVVGRHIIFEHKSRGYDLDELQLTYLDILDGKNVYEIMQYAGIKDRSGKEIYEGDVFINKWKVGHTSLHRVYFCEEELAFMSLTNLNGELIKESLAGYAEGYDIRVIGNIYKNPELLEETAC